MGSVCNALIGLVGVVCSGALAFGLVANPLGTPAPVELETTVIDPDGVPSFGDFEYDETTTPDNEPWDNSSASPVVADRAAAGPALYRICRVTAYCDRGTTASGVQSGLGQCAAPEDIPFGSIVYIPALDQSFVVTDRTHRRFRRSTVDIFLPTAKSCRAFGRQFLECEITLPAGATADAGRR